MEEQLIDKVMKEVMRRVGSGEAKPAEGKTINDNIPKDLAGVTEFVGIGMGDTQGIVIANLDPAIHKLMDFDTKYRSIGIIGGRVGAGPQLMAADEAVKATNTEIIRVEMPRDT